MTRSYTSFPTNDILTERDRTNIDIWAKIVDRDNSRASRPRTTIRLPQDLSLLHEYGFDVGFSGSTWFNRDHSGFLWRVAGNGVWWKNTEPSPVKPDKWVKHKEGLPMKLREFRQLFSTKGDKSNVQ